MNQFQPAVDARVSGNLNRAAALHKKITRLERRADAAKSRAARAWLNIRLAVAENKFDKLLGKQERELQMQMYSPLLPRAQFIKKAFAANERAHNEADAQAEHIFITTGVRRNEKDFYVPPRIWVAYKQSLFPALYPDWEEYTVPRHTYTWMRPVFEVIGKGLEKMADNLSIVHLGFFIGVPMVGAAVGFMMGHALAGALVGGACAIGLILSDAFGN